MPDEARGLIAMIGGRPLVLRIAWERRGEPIEDETQVFAVDHAGRVSCPYCGTVFRLTAFRAHYFPCRAESGEFGD